jgi:TetR/AcrR family transcriptional regulator, transcriptional repressor for nem operon
MARPRQFDPEITLDFAVDTFWESGFEATSIEKLCHNLKLNPGSLYGAYGDKRTLFLAILDRYIDKVSSEAIERIAGNPSGVAGIRAYFDFLIEAIIDGKRRWGCLLTNSLVELSGREPAVAAKVELHFARLETAFASALARSKAAGELQSDTGPELAPYFVCVVQGLNVVARTKPSRAKLQSMVRPALRLLEPTQH